MSEVVYFREEQGNLVTLFEALLDAAKNGDLQCACVSWVRTDGDAGYGRAGRMSSHQDGLKLLAAMEGNRFIVNQTLVVLDDLEGEVGEDLDSA